MPTVRIQEKNYSESIMVLKLKDGAEGCRVYLAHTCSLHRAGGDCADAGSVRG